jgi:hypothetical protein
MHARAFCSAVACLTLPLLAACHEEGEVLLPAFPQTQQHATQAVDLTIGSLALSLTSAFIDDSNEQGAALKKTVQGLKFVRVRSYEFGSDFVYPQAEIDEVRRQLSQPGWTPVVQVHDRNKNENVDIYLAHDEHAARGVAIIATNPRELTIVNIVGAVQLNQVGALRKMFSPPRGDAELAHQAAVTRP